MAPPCAQVLHAKPVASHTQLGVRLGRGLCQHTVVGPVAAAFLLNILALRKEVIFQVLDLGNALAF